MGVRTVEEAEQTLWQSPAGPSWPSTLLIVAAVFVLLVINGRSIGSGDTRSLEHVAASLAQEGNFDIDEYPEVTEPFAKTVGSHRVSVYPVVAAVLAAPIFQLASFFFDLDESGTALAGKWSAALLSALAAGLLFRAVAARRSALEARVAALLFAIGTSVCSTSQALWQHPATVLFVCAALLCLVHAGDDERWAARAGLPLALAAGSRHAAAPLVAVLFVATALRWRRQTARIVLWGLPAVLLVALYQWAYFGAPWRHGFSEGLSRFVGGRGESHAALLFSPAKGLLVFTPIAALAVIGLVRAARGSERWLATTCGIAFLAHWLVVGFWGEWDGGESFGPRLMTDALPLVFLFLPEGAQTARRFFPVLATASIAVQALGTFSYDYRWERLFQRQGGADRSWIWNVGRSPLALHAKEHVFIAALPAIRERHAFVREYRAVPFSPEGSRLLFEGDRVLVSGSEHTFGNMHLLRGARVENGQARLRGRWDGIFLRARPSTRQRNLEVRVEGKGQGALYVGGSTFWGGPPKYTAYPLTGAFRVRHAFRYADGADVVVTIGKAQGFVDVTALSLVPAGDALDPIVLDGTTRR